MVFSKAVSSVLHQQTLKQRSILTSRDTRLHAWVEAFDSYATRASRYTFVALHTLSGWVLPFFLTISSKFSLALIVVWARAAVVVAAPFNEENMMVC